MTHHNGSSVATKTFAAWLAKARKRAGLSYSQLAEKAGVSPATLHSIEHGLASPSLDTVEQIATALGTSVEASVRVRNVNSAKSAGAAVIQPQTTVPE
jgi:transcriptional regulator with XRE-family HTH domain